MAEQLAAKLNTRLNYQPKEEDDKEEEDEVETFHKYEEELEINDFPQQARWRVTSKVRFIFTYSITLCEVIIMNIFFFVYRKLWLKSPNIQKPVLQSEVRTIRLVKIRPKANVNCTWLSKVSTNSPYRRLKSRSLV